MTQEEIVCLPLGEPQAPPELFLVVMRGTGRALPSAHAPPIELVGRSAPFNSMMDLVGRVAPTDTAVLLVGESGTGKELVASLIHSLSARSQSPMVPLDCSGVAETLFESELFGHQKGAFTGATETRAGLIEACESGTLFLDEIADISPNLQAKLLRVLETGSFRRVGCAEQRHCSFRLICATNKDLGALVAKGAFRSDLYHRISAFPIRLPPLRERVGDLLPLIESLTTRLHCPNGCAVDDHAMAALSRYPFPGNVRELLNVLSRACVLSDDGVIRIEQLPPGIRAGHGQSTPDGAGEILPLREVEQRYIRWAATAFPGPARDLAALLGLSERTLYRKLSGAGSSPRGNLTSN